MAQDPHFLYLMKNALFNKKQEGGVLRKLFCESVFFVKSEIV